LLGRRRQIALAGELGVAQHLRGVQEPLDLAAVLAYEPVHRGRGRGRLGQRFHPVCRFALPGFAQLAGGLVARLGELRERQAVKAVDDLIDGHALILTARQRWSAPATSLPAGGGSLERPRRLGPRPRATRQRGPHAAG